MKKINYIIIILLIIFNVSGCSLRNKPDYCNDKVEFRYDQYEDDELLNGHYLHTNLYQSFTKKQEIESEVKLNKCFNTDDMQFIFNFYQFNKKDNLFNVQLVFNGKLKHEEVFKKLNELLLKDGYQKITYNEYLKLKEDRTYDSKMNNLFFNISMNKYATVISYSVLDIRK